MERACYKSAMRLLGVDPGTVRIGLSLSDEDGERAHPLRTLARTDDAQAAREILVEAKKGEVTTVVVGLPLDLQGREGMAAKKARALAAQLEKSGLKVVLWDERLTTAAAERTLKEQGLDATERRKVVDQVAATMLLQSYLDMLAHRKEQARDGESEWDDATGGDAPGDAPPQEPAAAAPRGRERGGSSRRRRSGG